MTGFYTTKQLAEYFNISYSIANILVHRRDFPSIKVGGQFRTIVDKLPEWMEKQTKSSNKT